MSKLDLGKRQLIDRDQCWLDQKIFQGPYQKDRVGNNSKPVDEALFGFVLIIWTHRESPSRSSHPSKCEG